MSKGLNDANLTITQCTPYIQLYGHKFSPPLVIMILQTKIVTPVDCMQQYFLGWTLSLTRIPHGLPVVTGRREM